MKKTTLKNSSNLKKRLAQYGALTAAIAGVADANGQIIYTDITPDEGGAGVQYLLDMDNDGTDDFSIRHFSLSTYGYSPRNNLFAAPISSNGAILGIDSTYDYPFALNAGQTISSSQTTWLPGNGYYKTMNYNSCGYSSSQWCDATDKYLGLRFEIAGAIHYGWARLDVNQDSGSGWLIKDYAYNSVAGEAIDAGQTLSVDEYAINEVKIVSLNKSIALYNLPQNTNYKLLDISGKSVLSGTINDHTYVIEANGVSNGIYIVELTDTFTKAVIRKKIVL
ncbi:T9SS type A sorting domain-containing protein [Lacinutrix cladophorae]